MRSVSHATWQDLWKRSRRTVTFLTRNGWLPLAAMALAVAGLWAFLELADEVEDQETLPFDTWLFETIAGSYENVGSFWQEAGRDLTALGGSTVITLMVCAVTIFLLLKRQWRSTAFVLVSVVGGLLLSLWLKEVYDRPRPELFEHRSHTITPSFPSGHSSNSAVAYLTMAILLVKLVSSPKLKAYVLFVGLLVPVLVGLSRVAMAVHWPTDVVAGWLLGLAWGLFVWAAATFLQSRGVIEPEGLEEEEQVPETVEAQ